MALADAAAFRVTTSTAADAAVRLLQQQRTGVETLPSWRDWLSQRSAATDAPPVHLLTVNTRLSGDPEDRDPGLLDSIEAIVQSASPDMLVIYITPPSRPIQSDERSQYYRLEKRIHQTGYDVDAQLLRAPEFGSSVEGTGYYLVATRRGGNEEKPFVWPTERATFPGIAALLDNDADRRLYRHSFKRGRLPPILSAALRAVLRLVFSHDRV